jgi:hypothetical protein
MEEAQPAVELEKVRELHWLFSRMSFLSRNGNELQVRSALMWFAAMTSQLRREEVIPFLPHILSAVYRVSEGSTPQYRDLQGLANEAIEVIKSRVGVTTFVNAYAQIRTKASTCFFFLPVLSLIYLQIALIRTKRKIQRKIEAVLDPERLQHRRQKRYAQKKERKRRRIEAIRGYARKKKRPDISLDLDL